jgi:hypothetical protein
VYAQATATVTIKRGITTDGFGDVVDTGVTVATGVPMSILTQRKTVYTPEDGRVQQIRYYTGRASADTDLRVGDQVEDEATGAGYVVDDVDQTSSPVTTNDLRVDLRKVS